MFLFLARHRTLTMIASIAVLMAAVVFNIYLIISPNSEWGDADPDLSTYEINSSLPGFEAKADPAISEDTLLGLGISNQRLILIVAIFGVVIAGAIGALWMSKVLTKKQMEQDEVFRQQLERMASVFEKYKQVHGGYPLSSAYSPEHYTAVHLGKEWQYYQFPDDQVMKALDEEWPLVDKSKLSSIVYYPKNLGARYALYAHVSSLSKEESRDYNSEDSLPMAWGKFNYRLTSDNDEAGSESVPEEGRLMTEAPPTTSIVSASQNGDAGLPASASVSAEEASRRQVSGQTDVQLNSADSSSSSAGGGAVTSTFTASQGLSVAGPVSSTDVESSSAQLSEQVHDESESFAPIAEMPDIFQSQTTIEAPALFETGPDSDESTQAAAVDLRNNEENTV